MQELLQEDADTFVGQKKGTSKKNATFPEVFIFQWNLPLNMDITVTLLLLTPSMSSQGLERLLGTHYV